jgi:hypothetical protein
MRPPGSLVPGTEILFELINSTLPENLSAALAKICAKSLDFGVLSPYPGKFIAFTSRKFECKTQSNGVRAAEINMRRNAQQLTDKTDKRMKEKKLPLI